MLRKLISTLAIIFGLQAAVAAAAAAQTVGQFKGEIVTSFMRDGRNMRLEQPFGYIDPAGRHWDVPVGAITDGASIPRILWATHPPFTGKYRAAAVVHDYFCQSRSRSWRETHEVFYHAMRTAGVDDRTAKIMYGAVHQFGPRWGLGATVRGATVDDMSEAQQARFMRDLEAWVDRDKPSVQDIGKRLDSGPLR